MSESQTPSELFGAIARLLAAVGNLAKRHRQAGGLTRAQLASQTGLSIATIRSVEDGRIVDLTTWTKLLAHPSMRRLAAQASQVGLVRIVGHNGVGKR